MTERTPPTDADSLLARLDEDGIERLWVVYYDYVGRAAGKIIPKRSFRGAVRGGVCLPAGEGEFDLGAGRLDRLWIFGGIGRCRWLWRRLRGRGPG